MVDDCAQRRWRARAAGCRRSAKKRNDVIPAREGQSSGLRPFMASAEDGGLSGAGAQTFKSSPHRPGTKKAAEICGALTFRSVKILYQKLSRVKNWASFLSEALLQMRFQDFGLLRFALPNRRNSPTKLLERCPISRIPLHVPFEFILPIGCSGFRQGRFRTPRMPMPETTMNENHRFPFGKYDIGFARQILGMKSKSKPHRMGRFSDADFGGRILSRDAGHKPRPPFWR